MRTDWVSGISPLRLARRSLTLLACVPLLAWLSGCIEINRPKAMTYSTSSHYQGEGRDPANDDGGMSVDFQGIQDGRVLDTLRVQYGEPTHFSLAGGDSKTVLELKINTRPNLKAVEDFLESADVKVEVTRYEPVMDSLTGFPPDSRWQDSVLVRYHRKGAGGAWELRDFLLRSWIWERHGDEYRRYLDLRLPESLLGPTPVLGWRLIRYRSGSPVRLPYQPTLYIRDEQGFKNLVYP